MKAIKNSKENKVTSSNELPYYRLNKWGNCSLIIKWIKSTTPLHPSQLLCYAVQEEIAKALNDGN